MNISATQAIEEVELGLDHAKELVATKQKTEKLIRNKEFQLIVDKGYFNDEAVRLTHLVSDPTISDEMRVGVQRDLESIGAFKRFLQTKISMGIAAENSIEAYENDLEHLRLEEIQEEEEAINNGDYNA